MMNDAAPTPSFAPRRTVLQRLRARFLILALSFTLAFSMAAPQPAHAVVGIDDAVVNFLGALQLQGAWAKSISAQVRIAVRAYFHVLMQAIRAKGQYDTALAEENFREEVTRRSLEARLIVENIPSPNKSTCRATTAQSRVVTVGALGDAAAADMATQETHRSLGIGPRRRSGSGDGDDGGGGPGGPGGSGDDVEFGPGGNSTASAIDLIRDACKKGYDERTPANIRRCAEAGVPEDQIGSASGGAGVVMAGADKNAAVLLDPLAFDTAQHHEAAMAYCRNMVLNTQMEIATQSQATRSTDNLRLNNKMYAEAAAKSLADFVCQKAVAVRAPADGRYNPPFANASSYNELYDRFLKPFGWSPVSLSTVNSVWPPAPSDDDPAPTSYSASQMYVEGRAPSLRQRQAFNAFALYDGTRILGSAVSPIMAPKHMIMAKAVTLSQNMERYRLMERELLFEAIQLARKVRKGKS